MKKHIQIRFPDLPEDKKEMLIAVLSDENLQGFQEEANDLFVYFNEEGFDENMLQAVIEPFSIGYEKELVEERNWNAEWESGFAPIVVNDPLTGKPFAYIRADFHDSPEGVPHELVITPKMSFGTGHHATTMLMMEQMSQINFAEKKVIDFGTGTGVLAILAHRLGAGSVEAIDCDTWSIENAAENFQRNHCEGIKLSKQDTLVSGIGKADVILANINLNVILDNLDNIIRVSNEQSIILFSGILDTDKEKMETELSRHGFQVTSYAMKNNWLLIKATLNK